MQNYRQHACALRLILTAACLLSSGPSAHGQERGPACLASGTYDRTVMFEGVDHRYRLQVPTSAEAAAGLLLQYHGGGSNGLQMDAVTNLSQRAEVDGFLLVTPEGWTLPQRSGRRRGQGAGGRGRGNGVQVWNAGGCCGPSHLLPDHVGATAAILDDVAALGACFDTRRVFATGHSNGGMMSYRLACELSDRIAAVAASASVLSEVNLDAKPPEPIFTCAPDRPVPVLHVHGLSDQCVPYDGGFSANTGRVRPPVEDTIDHWREHNGCQATGTETTNSGVRRRTWQCEQGTSVELITVEPLGHPWAGSPLYGSANTCGGSTDFSISTTEELLRFFGLTASLFRDGFESGNTERWG